MGNDSTLFRLEAFCRSIRESGLRVTPQRLAVYEFLMGTTEHPSAEAVYAAVQQKLPSISANTVYDTLGMLEQMELVTKINPLHDRARYDGNTRPHPHIVCVRCGAVEDFKDSPLNRFKLPEDEKKGYKLIRMTIQYEGICPRCKEGRSSRRQRQASS